MLHDSCRQIPPEFAGDPQLCGFVYSDLSGQQVSTVSTIVAGAELPPLPLLVGRSCITKSLLELSIMGGIQDARVHAPVVFAEGACLIFVCSLMVSLRFYARRVSGSSLGLDDGAAAAALVSLSGLNPNLLSERMTDLRGTAFGGWNVNHADSRFESAFYHQEIKIDRLAETAMKGLGYSSAVGDAGAGHPDANVVSTASSI